MGRFLGASPTAAGDRYAAVPRGHEDERPDARRHAPPTARAPATALESSSSSDGDRQSLTSDNSSSRKDGDGGERLDDAEDATRDTSDERQGDDRKTAAVAPLEKDCGTDDDKDTTASGTNGATAAAAGDIATVTGATAAGAAATGATAAGAVATATAGGAVAGGDGEAIVVRILDLNGKFFSITCRLDWRVSRLKQHVLESTDVAVASQRLIYRGRVLEDDASLESYKVEDGHTIHLFVRTAPTPDPELLSADGHVPGSSSSSNTNGARDDGLAIVHINSEVVSSAVFPSDSARRVDPLMLDSSLGNCARRVKLWSSFLLIIYTMKVMGQFALLANDQQQQQQRAARQEQEALGIHEPDRPMNRYDEFPQYFKPDPVIGSIELMVHCFGVYVGCVGFKAAHDTDIRPIRFYCRGVVWLAFLTVMEQIYTTVRISESDFPTERVRYPYGGQGPTKEDVVSANVFQTIMLVAMWLIAIRHSYMHQREVAIYNQSFAAAAMNAAPPVHLPDVV
ncbi:unnamed protein product [Hyaloperonospora brassicae]|uniref:Ubiquitin-like domain-containing protein n=1 Tax=Hyaloperonospora brassicae TaxID=162125 RepID=A0AAV0TAP4_HYABA|nr:unnamed protein product [Hyaloperonospora brassicae]